MNRFINLNYLINWCVYVSKNYRLFLLSVSSNNRSIDFKKSNLASLPLSYLPLNAKPYFGFLNQ